MSEKLEQILKLVGEYISDKRSAETWAEGDWVKYSGLYYDAEEYKSAVETLLGEWLIFGEKAREFEREFPQFLGKKHGIFTNSGSSANLIMTSVLRSVTKLPKKYRVAPGAKFITPIVCFPTTINPLLQNGYEPVFVDVDIPSLNLNLDQVEKLLIEDTNKEIRGIIFAHVLGNPPDMDRLMSLVDKYDLIFLEDACDALGSYYDGKRLGSFGHLSSCSFFPAHHMTTGEGGFVATDRNAFQLALASYRDWGRACYCNSLKPGDVTEGTACGDRFKNWLPGCKDLTYDHRYVFDEIGFNLKPLELQAALGLEQIKKLPEMEQSRRDNFSALRSIFSKYEKYFHLPEATDKSDPCWFGFMLIVKDNDLFDRQEFVNFMEFSKVQTRSYFTGNALYHPAYRHLADPSVDLKTAYPNAHIATKNAFFLGTFIGYTPAKLEYIKKQVDFFFETLED